MIKQHKKGAVALSDKPLCGSFGVVRLPKILTAARKMIFSYSRLLKNLNLHGKQITNHGKPREKRDCA
ncbi:hypothetical protein [Megasphaera elsdenii]|uniref:hypothetical protein n=3 Tax=Megasphaera elsdenii TaxID=907 RepID=UPI0022E43B0E|nr:hypothetical protein [Megasphaera elsdenii]